MWIKKPSRNLCVHRGKSASTDLTKNPRWRSHPTSRDMLSPCTLHLSRSQLSLARLPDIGDRLHDIMRLGRGELRRRDCGGRYRHHGWRPAEQDAGHDERRRARSRLPRTRCRNGWSRTSSRGTSRAMRCSRRKRLNAGDRLTNQRVIVYPPQRASPLPHLCESVSK